MKIAKLLALSLIIFALLAACTQKAEPSSVAEELSSSESTSSEESPESSELPPASKAFSALDLPSIPESSQSGESSQAVPPNVEEPYIIKIVSTADKSIAWSTSDEAVAENVISLLMTQDVDSPLMPRKDAEISLDIREKDFVITINQNGGKSEYHFWLDFKEKNRAIVKNANPPTISADESENDYLYAGYWDIPVEESNQLRELLKSLAG